MDEDDIDSWYDEEKEKVMAEFLADIDKKKDKAEIEKKFKNRQAILRKKYANMYEKFVKREKKRERIIKRFKKIKEGILKRIPLLKK